jgi:hypothetical protein
MWNSRSQGTPSNAETDGRCGELRGPACTLEIAAGPGTWSLWRTPSILNSETWAALAIAVCTC